jgi:putative CocE/NonD family hydrolase
LSFRAGVGAGVTGVVEERDVRVKMRDGVELSTDVWRPDAADPVPVLVMRTPYGKGVVKMMAAPVELAEAGFAVVIQDSRGRFDSDGEWGYVHCEVEDGYDTVEWAAARPWSNGRVGMFGASYMGYTQWLAAVSEAPHLEVIAPECCAADYWVASFDSGGAFRLAVRLGWTASMVASMASEWGISDETLDSLDEAFLDARAALIDPEAGAAALQKARTTIGSLLEEVYRLRPIMGNPLWHGRATWLDEIFDHEERSDSNWLRVNPSTHYASLDLPALHIGGWYDIHLQGTLDNFVGMRRQAATNRARLGQRLVVGPWSHWTPMSPMVGVSDFGEEAVIDPTAMRLAWFRHWLQGGEDPGWAPVRIFVMGANVWRDEQDWPLERTSWTRWYLGSGGALGPEQPVSGSSHSYGPDPDVPDSFLYDPRDPAPSSGGRVFGSWDFAGPADQALLDERHDVLAYTSPPLGAPMEITGPVRVELWASTDAPDTDFTAVLAVVTADGRALNLCEGAVRARHSGLGVPLSPGAVYHFSIDLVATSVVVPEGDKLRLYVSSSSFPEWEPNPNTGNPIGTDRPEDLRPAHQRIHHGALHPSHVVLPVIPAGH